MYPRSMVAVAVLLLLSAAAASAQDWPVYGGDPGGARYSAAALITKANVGRLAVAWTYHTGEAERRGDKFKRSSFQVTPVLADGKLVLCTPFDRVVALDPASGREIWAFDAQIAADLRPGNGFVCRGVAVWHDAQATAGAACAARVFLSTLDARVIALDLETGKRCGGFGAEGEVALPPDVPPLYHGELQFDSPPAILGDNVVIGSAVDDMTRERAPSGTVWALDARSGRTRWSFDPVPRRPEDPAAPSWAEQSYTGNAGGGAWAPMAVDAGRDLVFLPTASPTAAFYGGNRRGDDL